MFVPRLLPQMKRDYLAIFCYTDPLKISICLKFVQKFFIFPLGKEQQLVAEVPETLNMNGSK